MKCQTWLPEMKGRGLGFSSFGAVRFAECSEPSLRDEMYSALFCLAVCKALKK